VEVGLASEVTRLLASWRDDGSQGALDELMPLVYDELRRLAGARLRSEPTGHTLQPTALVHEAYARLVQADVPFENRVHFFAVAARMMRRILVDHARKARSEKRGGGMAPVTLDEQIAAADGDQPDVLALDEALERLAALEPRKAQAVELHYFGGLTYQETASALDVSEATVDRDLRMARAWLATEMARGPDE
jgi:RNA polymerase sigma-70 factor (ECF subfamily)